MKKLQVIVVGLIVFGAALFLTAAICGAGNTSQVGISASVTGTCKFLTGGTITYTLDPSVGTTASGTVTQPTFWCTKGSAYTISDDNGANKDGTTYRMKHASLSEYIPYSFTYTSTGTGTGRSTTVTMNIASSVLGTDYADVSVGNYSDVVTLTILP